MTVEKVGRAMSWNLLAKVARMMAVPVSYIIVVRILGDYNWGFLNILKTIKSFALVVILLGGGNAVLKYLPSLRVKGGMRSFIPTLRRLMVFQLLVWGFMLAAVFFTSSLISSFYSLDSGRYTIYIVVAIAMSIFELSMLMVTNILQSWYETKRLSLAIVIGNVCYLVLLMLLLKLGTGIVGYFAAGAAVNMGMTISLLPGVIGLFRSNGDDGMPSPRLGKVLRFSLPFVVTGFLNQVVWRHSEVLILGRFSGMEATGFFGLGYDIPQMALEFIPLTIWPIVLAGTSEVYARSSENLPGAIDIYYRLLYILVMPVAALGFAFARPLIPLLFGSAKLPAAILAQLFFVVFSYSFLYTPLSMALYVMEKSWVNMIAFSILAVINVGLDLLLIPRYGLWGALPPVAITFVFGIAIFRLLIVRYEPHIRIPAGFIFRAYIAALPAAMLALVSSRYSSLPALAVEIAVAIALLFGGFRVMRIIGEREKKLILKLPIPFREKLVDLF